MDFSIVTEGIVLLYAKLIVNLGHRCPQSFFLCYISARVVENRSTCHISCLAVIYVDVMLVFQDFADSFKIKRPVVVAVNDFGFSKIFIS